MPVVYVGNGPWGVGVGRSLTVPEHDGNNYDHKTRIDTLEADDPSITMEAEYTGGSITFLVDGGDEVTGGYNLGPFALPVAKFNPVGAWQNSTTYNYLDLVEVPGSGVYLVNVGHVSPAAPAEFDPAAVDGEDNLLYSILFYFQDITQLLKFRGDFEPGASYAAYDVIKSEAHGSYVVLIDHTAGLAFDPVAEETAGPLYWQIAGPRFDPPALLSGASHTLALEDAGIYYRCTNASGCEITIPDDGTVEFPTGTEIHFRQADTGAVSFVEGATGVIINPQRDGYDTATPWQGATVTLKKVAVDEWDLLGPFGDVVTA